MTRRLLINLTIVLLALGLAAVTWLDPHEGPARLTGLAPVEVDVLQVQRAEREPLRLERRSDGWWLTEPATTRASDDHVAKILDLVRARSRARYSLDEVDAAELELTPAPVHVAFNGTGVALGATDAMGRLRYALVDETVHLVDERVMPLLTGSWWNLADRRLLGADREPVALATPDLELQRDAGGWQVVRGDVSEREADAIMTAWQEAEALVARPVSALPDDPDTATITFADGSERIFARDSERGEMRLVDRDSGLAYVIDDGLRTYLLTGRRDD